MFDAVTKPAADASDDDDDAGFGRDALVLFGQADRLAMMIHQRKRRDFGAWLMIGKAIATAKAHLAARHGGSLTHPGRPWTVWLDRHPGLRAISESDRSSATWLWANHEDVIAWRDTLPEETREKLCHPQTNRLGFNRHVRMLVASPVQKPATKAPDLRCFVVRLEKILQDLAQRHAALEVEVVGLRATVAALEAHSPGSMRARGNGIEARAA